MKISLFQRIVIGSILSLLLILALGFLDLITTERLSETYQALAQSKNAVINLERASSLIKDVQRAHRGFLITKDKRFLGPYYNSLEEAPKTKSRLVSLHGWTDQQRSEVRVLAALIDRKLEFAEHALFGGNLSHPDSLIRQISLGKIIVDSANYIIARLENQEETRQRDLERRINRRISQNRTVIATSIVTFSILLAAALIELARVLRQRHLLFLDLQKKNQEASEANEELKVLNEELNASNEHLATNIAKLEAMQRELSIREKQLHHAQKLTRTGSFILDLSDGTLSYSKAYREILELREGEEIVTFSDFLMRVHPEDRARLEERKNVFYDRSLFVIEYRLFVSGRVKFIAATGQRVDNEDRSYFLGTISDVTDIQVKNQELRQTNMRLTEANQNLESFTYSISHDLKAPLRSVLIYANLLMDRIRDSAREDEKKWASVIHRKTRHMGELIDGLLALSRLGSISLQMKDVDMGMVVEEIVEELVHQYPRTTVIFDKANLGFAFADPGLIRQVWVNLLSNSFKFSDRVSAPKVEVRRRDDVGFVAFTVSDNGIGFHQKHSQDLFQVFKRLHAGEEFQGTGIGLVIVKKIVDAHGGQVIAEGMPGIGAQFTFTLPTSTGS